jgi:hypothetical protein
MCFEGPLTSVVEGLIKTFGAISLRFHRWQHHWALTKRMDKLLEGVRCVASRHE